MECRRRCPGSARSAPGAAAGRRERSPSRRPGTNCVAMTILPPCSGQASAAFFTRLRKTWTSRSRLPQTGGKDGSYSSRKPTWRAKPAEARRRTWFRTSWILTGDIGAGRSSLSISMRVDQADDAIGLVADQLRQDPAVALDALLQKLRRAADSGERVLDLMGQHGRHRLGRAGCVAAEALAVEPALDAAVLHHQDDMARVFGDRCGIDRDMGGLQLRSGQCEIRFGNRDAAVARLGDQREDRLSPAT